MGNIYTLLEAAQPFPRSQWYVQISDLLKKLIEAWAENVGAVRVVENIRANFDTLNVQGVHSVDLWEIAVVSCAWHRLRAELALNAHGSGGVPAWAEKVEQ